MQIKKTVLSGWTAALAAAVLAGCGAGSMSSPTISGVVQADAPVAATVALRDSSGTAQTRTATAGPDGSFTFDVSGLTPPFVLRAQWSGLGGTRQLYAASELPGTVDVNQLTDAAFSGAASRSCEEEFERSDSGERSRVAREVTRLLSRLRTVLAPLFQLYGISDPVRDATAVRAMLADVRFRVREGTVTVTNRSTGGVIFTGPLRDLSSGTFHPENLPPGPGTPPPPAGDGATLYGANCASCHGPLATSDVRGESANDIREAIEENEGGMGVLRALSSGDIAAIAAALSGSAPPPPPPTTDGPTLYAQSCAGCHGPLATSDVRGASAASIQAAIDGDRGGMGSAALRALNAAQVSAIAAALGTTPPPPPPATCTSFTYSAFGTCVNGTQSRTVVSASPAGCTGGSPVLTQACTVTPPPPATCTSFTYTPFGACVNGTQTRTVASASPAGCTGGNPVLTQACTVTPPPIDGAALYTQHCAGCHGNSQKGASASSIQSAIDSNRGGMGSAALRALTPEQIAAISAAP